MGRNLFASLSDFARLGKYTSPARTIPPNATTVLIHITVPWLNLCSPCAAVVFRNDSDIQTESVDYNLTGYLVDAPDEPWLHRPE